MINKFFIGLALVGACQCEAQTQKQDVAIAAGGVLLSVFATAAAYEAFIEDLENTATEWVLSNMPEIQGFKLKLLNLRGEQFTNMSEVSSCTFLLSPDAQEPIVLMWVTSRGWWNEYGIDYSRITVELFDRTRWLKVLEGYLKAASGESAINFSTIPIYSIVGGEPSSKQTWENSLKKYPSLKDAPFTPITPISDRPNYFQVLRSVVSLEDLRNVTSKSFRFSTPTENNQDAALVYTLPTLDGDYYRVSDIDGLRIVYNEKSFNIYFATTGRLVKFRSVVFEEISRKLLGLE